MMVYVLFASLYIIYSVPSAVCRSVFAPFSSKLRNAFRVCLMRHKCVCECMCIYVECPWECVKDRLLYSTQRRRRVHVCFMTARVRVCITCALQISEIVCNPSRYMDIIIYTQSRDDLMDDQHKRWVCAGIYI